MLSHAVGSTDRGAIGLLVCDANGESPKSVLSDGPSYSEEEMAEFREKSNRTITPFGIGSGDVEIPVTYGPETDEVIVRIIGNSYYPKIVKVAPGTNIKWVNEDVCTPHPYMEGKIIVTDIPAYEISSAAVGTRSKGMAPGWVLISLTLLALIIALIALINK